MIGLLASGVSASAAPARPPAAVFFGISVPDNDFGAISAASAAAGVRPTVDGIFTRLDSPSFTPSALRAIGAAGMTPLITLEPWAVGDVFGAPGLGRYRAAAIAAGAEDAAITRVARVIAESGTEVYLRYAHEMNGWWYPWAVGQNGNTAADYVAAWRHVATLLRAGAGSLIRLVWAPAAVTGSAKEQDARAAYPGDAWVDAVGMSAYGRTARATDAIDPTYRLLTSFTSLPVILCETGADGPDKRAWIAGFGDALAARPQIRGFVWNNSTPDAGASGDYRFDGNDLDSAAFRSTLSRLDRVAAVSTVGAAR